MLGKSLLNCGKQLRSCEKRSQCMSSRKSSAMFCSVNMMLHCYNILQSWAALTKARFRQRPGDCSTGASWVSVIGCNWKLFETYSFTSDQVEDWSFFGTHPGASDLIASRAIHTERIFWFVVFTVSTPLLGRYCRLNSTNIPFSMDRTW